MHSGSSSIKLQLTALIRRDTVLAMKSAVAEYAEQQLIEAAKKLTHEQRLAAFVEQCRLLGELHEAGRMFREEKSRTASQPLVPQK